MSVPFLPHPNVYSGNEGFHDHEGWGGGIYWPYLSSIPLLPFLGPVLPVAMMMMMMAATDSLLWKAHAFSSFHVILMGMSVTEPAPLDTGGFPLNPSLANQSTLLLVTRGWFKEWACDPNQPASFFSRSYLDWGWKSFLFCLWDVK